MKKRILVIGVAALLISLILYGITYVALQDEQNKYFDPVEARYVGQNTIQNSEGYACEYEYEFEFEGEKYYYHNEEEKKFDEVTIILVAKVISANSQSKQCPNRIKPLESGKELWEEYKIAFFIFRIIIMISAIFSGVTGLSILFSKKIEKRKEKVRIESIKAQEEKDKLWIEKIPRIKRYIKKNYREYEKILPLLDKLAKIIKELDNFYNKNTKDEEAYSNGLRKNVENIINLYIDNIEIDEGFKEKLITSKVNEEFYQNLDKFISYINNEISNLTRKNDESISKNFDVINSKAELSGAAIKYLADKYEK